MLSKRRIILLAGVVMLGGLLGIGAGRAEAQIIINNPGVGLGLGAPGYGLYGAGLYPAYGVAVPVVGAYPVPVQPYPYVYGRPGYYGRPYYGHHYGPYRRW